MTADDMKNVNELWEHIIDIISAWCKLNLCDECYKYSQNCCIIN